MPAGKEFKTDILYLEMVCIVSKQNEFDKKTQTRNGNIRIRRKFILDRESIPIKLKR